MLNETARRETVTTKSGPDRYAIHSVEKALDVFEVLSTAGSASLNELAELVQQPKSSLYRIIATLEKRGFIDRSDEDGKYCLGYKQLVITKQLLERSSLRNAAMPKMNKLVERFGDTVNLCVMLDGEIMYVEIIEGTHTLRMADKVGSKSPFHTTAAGKAIAAHQPERTVKEWIAKRGLPPLTPLTIANEADLFLELDRVRRQGYALDKEENVLGARCIGVPLFDMFGAVQGAISLSGAVHRYPDSEIESIAAAVIEAGRAISRQLGYHAGT